MTTADTSGKIVTSIMTLELLESPELDYIQLYINYHMETLLYEGCSNMNASSFITFFIYMLRQNVIPFWKELFVAF